MTAGSAIAIDDLMKVRSRQFGEPSFRQFMDDIGDADAFAKASKRRQLAAGAFGTTEMVEVEGKKYVVKTPKTPPKSERRAMATGLSDQARRNLYRAQGRVTRSEVANTRVAAALGIAPKVVAANKRHIVSEVAKGSTVRNLNPEQEKTLLRNLAKLHRAGIAHNDLKPDNFFIDNKNRMQFIDFGLSERSASGVAREWYRAMNPPSSNPLIKVTGTATGAFNLRRYNESGYKGAESALKRVLNGPVSEEAIIKAAKNPAKAKQLQLVINNFYTGKYNRRGGRMDAVEYQGETFSGYNKPKRTPSHPKKSHAVLAKEGDKVRLIRFGQQGVKGSPPRKGESKAYAARRRAFKLRHRRNIAKGRMSAAYWANRVKW